jgi:ATP-dependent Zn protease
MKGNMVEKRKLISEMEFDEVYKEAMFACLKASYNLANMVEGNGYQKIMTTVGLLSSSILTMFISSMSNQEEMVQECKINIQSILEESYAHCDALLKMTKEMNSKRNLQ